MTRESPHESQASKAAAREEDAAREAKNAKLPHDKGQFGTDIETEAYRKLGNPPGQNAGGSPGDDPGETSGGNAGTNPGQHQFQAGEKS